MDWSTGGVCDGFLYGFQFIENSLYRSCHGIDLGPDPFIGYYVHWLSVIRSSYCWGITKCYCLCGWSKSGRIVMYCLASLSLNSNCGTRRYNS